MMKASNQHKRVALVTGAARRIGASIVEYLHQHDWTVVIHCHQAYDEATALCLRLNHVRSNSAYVVRGNLAESAIPSSLIHDTIAWAGQLDLLVNNASVFLPTALSEIKADTWQTLFAINVEAPFRLSLAARTHLAKRAGAIINLTDIHAETPLKGYAAYCQSKAALAMQTKSLAKEFAPEIRVNAIAPGAIIWPENINELQVEQKISIIDKTLLRRHGDPVFIAQAVLALVDNPFITGQTLRVDGGR